MILIKTKEDIYPAIKELIVYFEKNNRPNIASILKHRMYEVSWTTQAELLEELYKVLKGVVEQGRLTLEELIINQIEKILQIIRRDLNRNE